MYKHAAEEDFGNPARFRLGLCYYEGVGVEQSYLEAAENFQKSALSGDLDGMYYYGLCLYHGQGVLKNPERAKYYWERCAERDYEKAKQAMQEYFPKEGK